MLELLAQSTQEGNTTHWNGQTAKSLRRQFLEIHPPSVLDISKDTEYGSQAAFWGIEVSSLSCFFLICFVDLLSWCYNVNPFSGFAWLRRNLSPRRVSWQAWLGRPWNRWMPSCCNASLLWEIFVGRSYKRSSGMSIKFRSREILVVLLKKIIIVKHSGPEGS